MQVLDVTEKLTPAGESAVSSFLTQQNLLSDEFSFVYSGELRRGGNLQVLSFARVPAVEGKTFIHETEYTQKPEVTASVSTILAAEPEVTPEEEAEETTATDGAETAVTLDEADPIYALFKGILPLKKGDGYNQKKSADEKTKIKSVQALIKALGGDLGKIDGQFGPKSVKGACKAIGKECTDAEVDTFVLDNAIAAKMLAGAKEKKITDTSLTAMIPAASSSSPSGSSPSTTPTPSDSGTVEIVFS
tara:strand:- start:656 stop:1396 length:741 start_codon:yes stop_codon:yes gene_type:complete